MPPKLPRIDPSPEELKNHVFIVATLKDPDPATGWRIPVPEGAPPEPWRHEGAADLIIMDWPIKRTNDGVEFFDFIATPERIESRILQEGWQVKSWRIVQYGEIPKDRTYRDALADIGGTLGHHLPKVKEIAMQHLREDRAPLLADLDVQWMRAYGQGKKQDADVIEAKRQELRDKPQSVKAAVEAAATVDEVTAIVAL